MVHLRAQPNRGSRGEGRTPNGPLTPWHGPVASLPGLVAAVTLVTEVADDLTSARRAERPGLRAGPRRGVRWQQYAIGCTIELPTGESEQHVEARPCRAR